MEVVKIVPKSYVLDFTAVLDPVVNISFMSQLKCSSKWSEVDYSNVPEKMQSNYE